MVAYVDRLDYRSASAFCSSWMRLTEREYPRLDVARALALIKVFREKIPFLREDANQDFELALAGGHLYLAALHYFVWQREKTPFSKISVVGWTAVRPHEHMHYDALSYIIHFEPEFLQEERRVLVRPSFGIYLSWDLYADEILFLVRDGDLKDKAPIWRDFIQAAFDYYRIDNLFGRVIYTLRRIWLEYKEEFISAVEDESDLPAGYALIRQLTPLVQGEPEVRLGHLIKTGADLRWERRAPAVLLWHVSQVVRVYPWE